MLDTPKSAKPRMFRVAIARDAAGAEVRPGTVGIAPFSCVDCGEHVLLRREHLRGGHSVRAHFAHYANAGCAFSEGEGEAYLWAKRRIVEAVAAHEPIAFVRHCPSCDREQRQRLPERVARAALEHWLPSGRRADVALLDPADQLLAVTEVFETHPGRPGQAHRSR